MTSFIEELFAKIPEGKKELVRADLRVDVTQTLVLEMERRNVTKSQLAKIIGVSRSAITQALSPNSNMSLNRLADIAAALGMRAEFVLRSAFSESDQRPLAPVADKWTPDFVVVTGSRPPQALEVKKVSVKEVSDTSVAPSYHSYWQRTLLDLAARKQFEAAQIRLRNKAAHARGAIEVPPFVQIKGITESQSMTILDVGVERIALRNSPSRNTKPVEQSSSKKVTS